MVLQFSSEIFANLGLQLAGYSEDTIARTCNATNARRLKDFCYAGGESLEQIYQDIQNPNLLEHQITNPNPVDLIHALYFLKKYPTSHEFAGRCGTGTEKTLLNRAWKYIRAIQKLKDKKIRWIFDRSDGRDYGEYFIISVDGVHCKIYEPRTQPSSGWYSKKHNRAGLTYEIGIAVHHNNIVWINGPFPAGQNDMKVFRKPDGLLSKIPDGCRAIGDEGYRGEPSKVSTRNSFNGANVKAFTSRVRARHETLNSRLKAFGVLSQMFRSKGSCRMDKHKSVFEACCVIVQYEMDNGNSLFKV